MEGVGHAQWVFTIPKMLRVYFLHHWELLGKLSQAAAKTAKELLAAAAMEEKGFRPGRVAVVQTFGDRANFHPHVHALVTRGGWTASGEWVPVPYVDERAAEELFRHKVLGLLRRRGLLSEERIELLLSWRRSGFSVHNRVYTRKGGHDTPVPPPSERAALRRRWANLIRRVYETDPLVCPRCGAEMRVIGFITEPGVIRRIVDHLRKRQRGPRPPPRMGPPVAVPAAASPVVRSAPC